MLINAIYLQNVMCLCCFYDKMRSDCAFFYGRECLLCHCDSFCKERGSEKALLSHENGWFLIKKAPSTNAAEPPFVVLKSFIWLFVFSPLE